jgi:ATP-binding cassette subfamily B (MDR/TAP) protein 1
VTGQDEELTRSVLALIGIACIPLLVSGGYLRLKVVVLKDRRMKKIHEGSAHLASEAAGAVRTIASLTREDDVDRIYSKSLEGPLRVAVYVREYWTLHR